ncbi:hypothetical protein CRUP_031122 [Coryphaenoides rupestris]|nr:hypothetical protein CRUP_031122 [Coryphaenoides rupestris]
MTFLPSATRVRETQSLPEARRWASGGSISTMERRTICSRLNAGPYNLGVALVLDEHIVDLAEQLKSIFTQVGFVYLENTGITQEEVEQVMSISKAFFLQPDEMKLPFSRKGFANSPNHGWVEQVMSISKAFFLQPDEMKLPFSRKGFANSPNHGWVSSETERDVHAAFFQRCQELSLRVLRVMAHSLGLDPHVFQHAHRYIGTDKNGSTLRSLYYPPVNSGLVKEGQLRCGEHSDYGSITLVFQSHEGGLQILSRSGDYITAPSIPGTVLINIADLMQRGLVKEGQLRCGEHSDYGSITLVFQSHEGGLQHIVDLAEQLKSIFTQIGFVYLENTGITQEEVEQVMSISKAFFLQPDEMKLPFSRKGFANSPNHGWVSSETERDVHAAFFQRCQELSLRVLRVMAHSLGLDPHVFQHAHRYIGTDKNGSTLRSLYYPPVNSGLVKEGQLRCGEHSDYGSITLVFQSHEGGLQILSRSGDYITAPSIPGTVLINIADLMQRWTSDQFISAILDAFWKKSGSRSEMQLAAPT